MMPKFIISSKAKETLIYPEAFCLLKHPMITTLKEIIRSFMKSGIYWMEKVTYTHCR